jgi:hypothetical protein
MGQSKQDSQQSPETAATQKPESAEATGKEGSAHEPKKVHLPDASGQHFPRSGSGTPGKR